MLPASSRREFLKVSAAGGLMHVIGGRTAVAADGDGADLIITDARIATLDRKSPTASALAIKGGKFLAVGNDREVMAHKTDRTRVISAGSRTVIPGLNDSHTHVIRGGLHYNMELRWDGVPSLSAALKMLQDQARRTPPPQWVRVIGGWSEFQFRERRMPTLDEINKAAPDTPVFILHLYDRAFLNQAALRALDFTKETPNPQGAEIQRDPKTGTPTGLLVARPNAGLLYSSLARAPKLSPEDQVNSTRQFLRELNRLGVTSVSDAGGGGHSYPENYSVVDELARQDLLTVRIAYSLFTQRPGREKEDFAAWIKMVTPGHGNDYCRLRGAGEMLTYSAADFEDFREPRPELAGSLETELTEVVTLLAKNGWPFRLHATYNESISRFLDVFEKVNRDVPLKDLRWFFDHAETISEQNINRVKALGGGIAVQHRMAFQGEYFLNRYGPQSAAAVPPIRRMLQAGLPVGAGTDATRVASFNPWMSLYWLVAGKTVGGTVLYDEANRLNRTEALRLFTVGSSWFSGEEDAKGTISPGQLADCAVLSADYFSVPEEKIKSIESVLTITGGKVVYASESFASFGPPPLPVSPDWSPVKEYGGYQLSMAGIAPRSAPPVPKQLGSAVEVPMSGATQPRGPGVALGCDCFAF